MKLIISYLIFGIIAYIACSIACVILKIETKRYELFAYLFLWPVYSVLKFIQIHRIVRKLAQERERKEREEAEKRRQEREQRRRDFFRRYDYDI